MSAGPRWHRMPRRLAILPLEALVWTYRLALSPLVGRQCRHVPTCSFYALDALAEHGPFRGSVLAARRVLRCHPLAKGGYDPVPIARPMATPIDQKEMGAAGKCSLNSDGEGQHPPPDR